jgi:hypothetical protein
MDKLHKKPSPLARFLNTEGGEFLSAGRRGVRGEVLDLFLSPQCKSKSKKLI